MDKQAKKFIKGVKSNFNKAKRTYSCRTLKDLIRAYRACTSKSEERALVKKEAAHIRDLFREGDRYFQRRNITKLLFFHMNGYPTDFGITECIKLCASSNFADKRVAYLGLTILVDETEQLLMLMTNSLKQDLNNPDINIVTLALNVVGDVASAEMLRELLPDIETHMQSPNPQIRKKAGLAAVRAVRKLTAEETAAVLQFTPQFFDTRSSAVHISGGALVSALCEQDPENAATMRQSVLPIIISILSDHLTGSAPSRPADLYGSTHEKENPFLLAKLVTALRSMLSNGHGPIDPSTAENIGALLVSLAAKFDSASSLKMMQCSILLEIVRTSAYVRAHSEELQDFITKVLGRFLTHREATVRYIALQELNAMADVDGVSALAGVSQLGEKLLSSLREADRTVRRQGAELVFRTTDASNVQKMVSEMASYVSLSNADEDFDSVRDGCEKLFLMADQYGPADDWKLDVFVNALTLGHRHLHEALISCLVSFISAHPNVRTHAVLALFGAVLKSHALAVAANSKPSNAVSLLDGDGFIPASNSTEQNRTPNGNSAPEAPPQRMPRAESVALYIVGEFGGVDGLASMDIVNACEALMFDHEGIAGAEFDAYDQYTTKISAVNQAALSALLKVAARELGVSHTDSNVIDTNDGGLADMFAGLGLPALPAPPPATSGSDSNAAGSELAMQLITMGEVGDQLSVAAIGNNNNSGVGMTDLVALGIGDDVSNSGETSGALTLFDGGASVSSEGGTVVTRIRQIFSKLVSASDVEVQQRACEYLSLLDNSAEARSALSTAVGSAPKMPYRGVRAVVDEIRAHSHDHLSSHTNSRSRSRNKGKPLSATGAGNVGLLLDLMADDEEADSRITDANSTTVIEDDPLAALGALVVADSQPVQPATSSMLSTSDNRSIPPHGAAAMDDLLSLTTGESVVASNNSAMVAIGIQSNNDAQGLNNFMDLGMDSLEPMLKKKIPPPTVNEPAPETGSIRNGDSVNVPNTGNGQSELENGQQVVLEEGQMGEELSKGGKRFVIMENNCMRLEASLGELELVDGDARQRGLMIMTNLSQRQLSEFVLQLAVPKYMRLEMEPASGSEANHGQSIQQVVHMLNRAHGAKPMQFRYIVGFRLDGDEDITRLQGLADDLL